MIPLSRNRSYRLLWTSQVVAEFGSSASMIALPLLVLGVTGSPAASGIVLSVAAAARLIAGLPMGALADRWNRKNIMLGCEAASVIAAGSLVAALAWDVVTVGHIVAVAAVMGLCSALFEPAEDACLPNLVPPSQLPNAVAMNSARSFLGHLFGTAAGGFFFALGRVVPFAAEMVSHAVAFVGLAFLRVPAREVRPEPGRHLGHEMVAGLRWVWQNRPIRVIALCAVGLNLFFAAYYIVIILLAQASGVPAGEIGIMAAMLGVGGLLGTLVAPYAHGKVTPYQSMMAVFWVLTALTPLAVFTRNGYFMGGVFAVMAFVAPTANTTIETYGLLLTPDDLRGRWSGVMGALTGVAAAVGPALGGLLLAVVSDNEAVLLCTAGIGIVTLLATASPTLRSFPRATDAPLGGDQAGAEPGQLVGQLVGQSGALDVDAHLQGGGGAGNGHRRGGHAGRGGNAQGGVADDVHLPRAGVGHRLAAGVDPAQQAPRAVEQPADQPGPGVEHLRHYVDDPPRQAGGEPGDGADQLAGLVAGQAGGPAHRLEHLGPELNQRLNGLARQPEEEAEDLRHPRDRNVEDGDAHRHPHADDVKFGLDVAGFLFDKLVEFGGPTVLKGIRKVALFFLELPGKVIEALIEFVPKQGGDHQRREADNGQGQDLEGLEQERGGVGEVSGVPGFQPLIDHAKFVGRVHFEVGRLIVDLVTEPVRSLKELPGRIGSILLDIGVVFLKLPLLILQSLGTLRKRPTPTTASPIERKMPTSLPELPRRLSDDEALVRTPVLDEPTYS